MAANGRPKPLDQPVLLPQLKAARTAAIARFSEGVIVARRFDPFRVRNLAGPVEPVQAIVCQLRTPGRRSVFTIMSACGDSLGLHHPCSFML